MGTKEKIDLYQIHNSEYVTPGKPVLVEIKPASYLAITGQGEPGGDVFQAKLGALYNVAFTVKMEKKLSGQDYTVCKLEGLWWGNLDEPDFTREPPSTWNWKLIIRVPDFITEKDLKEAIQKLQARGKPSEVAEIQLETLKEGRCVQILHVGPYSEEHRSIAMMIQLAEANGLTFHGLHHEIYLSDPRRVAPARLRTILRYPVREGKR